MPVLTTAIHTIVRLGRMNREERVEARLNAVAEELNA
jgi:hypothetical protein